MQPMMWLSHQQVAGSTPVDIHRNSEQLSVLGPISHLSQDGRKLERETECQYLVEQGRWK